MYLQKRILSYVFLLYLKMSSYYFLESFLGPRSKRGAFHNSDRQEKVGKKQKESDVKKRLRGGQISNFQSCPSGLPGVGMCSSVYSLQPQTHNTFIATFRLLSSLLLPQHTQNTLQKGLFPNIFSSTSCLFFHVFCGERETATFLYFRHSLEQRVQRVWGRKE